MIRRTDDSAPPKQLICVATPVLLVGAGPVAAADLALGRKTAQHVVAADGGAACLTDARIVPDAVIGDMDSLSKELRAQFPTGICHPVSEQDSTDFEKCLTRIAAPLVLAVGFSGGRMDHLLAVLNVMVRHPGRRCVVIGPEDVVVVLPPVLTLPLAAGVAVSLFPLSEVVVRSSGLRWPVEGLPFRPDGQIGTSNQALGPVTLACDTPGMLLFVPRAQLDLLITALDAAPRW